MAADVEFGSDLLRCVLKCDEMQHFFFSTRDIIVHCMWIKYFRNKEQKSTTVSFYFYQKENWLNFSLIRNRTSKLAYHLLTLDMTEGDCDTYELQKSLASDMYDDYPDLGKE